MKFLEAELDAIAQNRKVLPGFAEHVEVAGTHSRDKHLVLPSISLTSFPNFMKFLVAEFDVIAQNGNVLTRFCRACRNCGHTF